MREGGTAAKLAPFLKGRAPKLRRIASVCTSVFGPAAAVANRRVTTHWKFVSELNRRFPDLAVDRDAIFVKDGPCQNLGQKNAPVSGLKADDPAVLAPAGGVHLTMDDWARFAIDQMKGEHGQGKLLRTATYRFLHSGQAATSYGIGWAYGRKWMG